MDPAIETAKSKVKILLNKLPDDSTFEDIQYHLYVLEKIEKGAAAADEQGVIPQGEAHKRLGKWLTK